MRRGEIRLVDVEPVRGDEANKRRPAIIVSNDGSNAVVVRNGRGTVTIVPLSSNTAKVFPFQVIVPAEGSGLSVDSKAKAEHVRAVDVSRVGRLVGRVPHPVMRGVEAALRVHLAL